MKSPIIPKILRVLAVIGLFVFAFTLASPKAHANLISNGGFESTSNPAPPACF